MSHPVKGSFDIAGSFFRALTLFLGQHLVQLAELSSGVKGGIVLALVSRPVKHILQVLCTLLRGSSCTRHEGRSLLEAGDLSIRSCGDTIVSHPIESTFDVTGSLLWALALLLWQQLVQLSEVASGVSLIFVSLALASKPVQDGIHILHAILGRSLGNRNIAKLVEGRDIVIPAERCNISASDPIKSSFDILRSRLWALALLLRQQLVELAELSQRISQIVILALVSQPVQGRVQILLTLLRCTARHTEAFDLLEGLRNVIGLIRLN